MRARGSVRVRVRLGSAPAGVSRVGVDPRHRSLSPTHPVLPQHRPSGPLPSRPPGVARHPFFPQPPRRPVSVSMVTVRGRTGEGGGEKDR